MTNPQLAAALIGATNLQALARGHWEITDRDDLAERDAALLTVRHTTALVRALEQWIAVRAMRGVVAQRTE